MKTVTWQIDERRRINTKMPIIAANWQVLHFDEAPILFTGTNFLGNRIVGSSVYDDRQNGIERFIHSIVETKNYVSFIHQEIPYLSLLERAVEIYVINRHFKTNQTEVFLTDLDEIPREYLPLKDAYCPDVEAEVGIIYEQSLQGGIADDNSALPEEVGKIQNATAAFLRHIAQVLKDHVTARVVLKPATEGSYKINYAISFDSGDQPSFFQEQLEHDALVFINQYIRYCLNQLPKEVDSITLQKISDSTDFDLLLENFRAMGPSSAPDDLPALKRTLSTGILKAAKDLRTISESVGSGFTEMLLANQGQHAETVLGIIDEQYKSTIEETVAVLEERLTGVSQEIIEDQEPKRYKILIYHLNTDTRKGNAYIEVQESPGTMARPSIRISGDEPLEESKYTESIYLNKFIDILGTAVFRGKRCKSIDIIFETIDSNTDAA